MVSWTTRTIVPNKKPKYLSSPPRRESLPHKEMLFGVDKAFHTIIITEGPFNVFRIGPGAVATFGTDYTKAQFLKMLDFPTRVICFDKGAEYEAQRLYNDLSVMPGETVLLTLETGDDPAEADEDEIQQIRGHFLERSCSDIRFKNQ